MPLIALPETFLLSKEFDFSLNVDVMEGGSLGVIAVFEVNAKEISPAQTLSDISSSLRAILTKSGDTLENIASSFGGGVFDSAAELFASIVGVDKIALLLNAKLNAEARLDLSFDSTTFSTNINELQMSLLASIEDEFNISIEGLGDVHIIPSVQLRLQAENIATPFDVTSNSSALGEFRFSGNFEGIMSVDIGTIPTVISLRAYSPHLSIADNVEFDVRLDIALTPIHESEYTACCMFIVGLYFCSLILY